MPRRWSPPPRKRSPRRSECSATPPSAPRPSPATRRPPQLAQEFYDLAALIFEDLTRNSGGDANKMRETLESAAKDPAALAALLRPATLDRLRALAVKISDRPR